jgi:hypothetical protein
MKEQLEQLAPCIKKLHEVTLYVLTSDFIEMQMIGL